VPAGRPTTTDRDPGWQPECQLTTAELAPACRRWLLDDSSLTARLIALGQGSFSVRRLLQAWQVPLLSERRLLQVAPRQRALVREVVLQLDQRPVVFARSVFPLDSLAGELGHLRRLGHRSLGAILFRYPAMQRSPFELARVAGDSSYLPAWLHQPEYAWARRSCFVIGGRRLLVSEVFLQSFRPWQATLSVHRSQRGKVCAANAPATQ